MLNKSLLTLFAFTLCASAADSVLVFNELQYHPANELTQTEWVELRSLQGVDVDISGWRIDGGIDYTFPAGTIMPGGGYIVVAAVPGQIAGSLGPFTGQLDNGGETLRLKNRTGRVMDELSYGDSGDWPVGADGAGATLARIGTSAASGSVVWAASAQLGGTPKVKNFAEATDPPTLTTLVALSASWKYRDNNVAQPVDWTGTAFDDSAWASGAALLYAGSPNVTGAGEGLYGYWPLSETTGTTAPNLAAGGTAGALFTGATWVTDGTRGQVLNLDGVDGYVNAGTVPVITVASNFTWSFWAYSLQTGGNVIVGNRFSTSGTDWSPREFIKFTSDQLQYDHNAVEFINYTDVPTNVWAHHAIVKQGSTFTYYRNGVAGGTLTISVPQANAQPFYFGGDKTNENWAGKLDDIAVWTKALPATSISSLAAGSVTPLTAPTGSSSVPLTTSLAQGPTTHYFRKAFTFSGAKERTTLTLQHMLDDGAVFYLNGTEVLRANMPAGAVAHSTAASSNITTTSLSSTLSIPVDALVSGANVLSVEVHQNAANTDMVFGAELVASETPLLPAAPSFVFSEITAASDVNFFVELRNASTSAASTSGWSIAASTGQTVAIPAQSIAAGGYLALNAATLGFTPLDGTKLVLLAPGGTELRDSREVTNRLRGRNAAGVWAFPDSATSGAANVVTVSDAIVINEIFYKGADPTPPTLPSGEQWVELYNKSASPVDVSGWQFSEGISYTFPAATPLIPAGGYVVVAWNPATFATLHAGVSAYGPFSGSLSGSGETIKLSDANSNVADEVRYHDGGRWSQWADGGGSSLELKDPDSDNSKGEAWDASDESSRSTWQNVSISGVAALTPANNPTNWNEFLFGLLNAGECLVDDISVIDNTQATPNLIQNGTFSGGNTNFWRIIGTHSGSVVSDAGNNVLKLVATAETEHMHNHAGTTLKNGASFHTLVSTDTYTITFRAKWLRGSNALHSRLYVNRLPLKTLLNRPTTGGTPGSVNSRFVANVGPTFDTLSHSPAVPGASATATVTVKVADPDGIGSVQLFTSINGAAFTSAAMTTAGGGVYSGVIAGQAAGAVVQFYVRATDTPGAITFFPAGGAASRAMIQWDDGRAALTLASGAKPHNIRVIMPAADAGELYKQENLMSNAAVPCTVILDERDIYYRAGVSLKSSEHGRFNIARVGYNIEFPPDDLFLGTHGGISIDRSGGTVTGQKEILLKSLSILAGGIHAPQDDIIRLIPAKAASPTGITFDGSGMLGAAILSKTRLKGDYVENQFTNGGDGMMFKYERIYVLTQTINAATRVVDASVVVENPKIPQDSTGPPGVAVTNLGANSEIYRWHWLVEGGRDADDYTGATNLGTPFPNTGIVNLVTAIGQAAGSTFNTEVDKYIDVNAWLRAHVPSVLYGVTDNYMAPNGAGSQHNTLFYFPPGQKAVAFPWDNDFLAQSNPTTTTLIGGDIAKFIANPVWKRLYYGHMLDILNRSFNTATMTTWATHYSRFGTDDMVASVSGYLTPRANYALAQVSVAIPSVAFARTSASPVTVATPFATVAGGGWVNIAEIRLQGSSEPLAVTWTDDNSWTLQLPVSAGTNTYTLVAYDTNGTSLGTTSVTVTGSGGIFPASTGNLVVTELHYNPLGSTEATEFIELLNVTGATLDLTNCHFDEELGQGIAFTFASGTQVAAGARIIVSRLRASFLAAYPAVPGAQVATGQFDPSGLDNGGERIVLYSAGGLPIFDFTYSDNLAPTDGNGRSMVRVVSSTAPNWSTYEWRASTLDGGNPNASDALAFSGPVNADVDNDGTPALLEYMLGTSDAAPGGAPFTTTRDVAGNLILNLYRQTNADDADISIEAVSALGDTWAAAVAEKTSDTTIGTLRNEIWQVTPPLGAVKFFVRLKATLR